MKHNYYAIWDKAAKRYVHISESINENTFSRMMDSLSKDEKTFVGQKPEDFTGYKVAEFEDETGEFKSIEPEKIWEGSR